MDNIVISWRELLLLAAIVLAVYIAEMLLMMRVSGGLRKPRWLDIIHEKKTETELRREIEALRLRLDRLEQATFNDEAELAHLNHTDDYVAQQTPTSDTPYNRAISLARQGVDADRLAVECGISRGEAELIVSMQQR